MLATMLSTTRLLKFGIIYHLSFLQSAWTYNMVEQKEGRLLHLHSIPLDPEDCCCCSVTRSCPILCDPMNCSTPGFPSFTISLSLLKLVSFESVIPSNHLILCHPLLLLPLVFPSIRVFSNESALHIRLPKY